MSVHGPVGVLDLHVPTGATGADVAREYSRQANLPHVPALYTRGGAPLAADVTLADAGVVTGAVLVATVGTAAPQQRRRLRDPGRRERVLEPGALSALWCVVAVVVALLAGWVAATLPRSSDLREVTIGLLVGAAVIGVLPLGPLAAHRVQAVPAFAGAAGYAIAWDPAPERLPTIIGVAALAAAICAAVARALDRPGEEGLRVWMLTGVAVFVVTTSAALVDAPAQVVWAVLLVAAMLAARFVPMIAIDVPDHYLLDVERLAVTAWSARERPTGRRHRTIVPRRAVAEVAGRGTRSMTAASTAILVVTTVSAVLLLQTTSVWIDVLGARLEVFFAGAGLLLAARSYRHVAARALLRASGLVCWATLVVVLVTAGPGARLVWAAWVSIGLGALLVLTAVALGRGWRSAWWSRRAEVGEALAGAFALACVVLAAGVFPLLWDLTS
ncbi:hypothetical protein ABFT23_00900 [Nocardioides sp. C4-1]|uniref:hypothetical protein n=1 Tax=Nocardioides sp. C4-1 TaxID=3151851 RepID=UPI0032667AA2